MKTLKNIALLMVLTLVGISMTSCLVRQKENNRDNGLHRGWYKNKNHHDHRIYVIDNKNIKTVKAPHAVKTKNPKKNRWDARK